MLFRSLQTQNFETLELKTNENFNIPNFENKNYDTLSV